MTLDHILLLTVAGSRAYGIETPSSDVDIKGACLAPLATYAGFTQRFEQPHDALPVTCTSQR